MVYYSVKMLAFKEVFNKPQREGKLLFERREAKILYIFTHSVIMSLFAEEIEN